MDLSRHTSLAGLAEAIGAVQVAAARHRLEVFAIGALARDLWLVFGLGVETGRKTEDIDLAVACADWDAFEAIAGELAAGHIERVDPKIAHRFRHPNGTLIDILPFGGVERADRTLAWPPDGDPVMNLLGFAEVATRAVPIRLPAGIEAWVVPLDALALLKLLAWEDRRQRAPRKDAEDLGLILRHYFAWRIEHRPQPGLDLALERCDFDERLAGAELLGQDLALLSSGGVRAAVAALLDRETDEQGALALARELARYEPEQALAALRTLRAAFESRGGDPRA